MFRCAAVNLLTCFGFLGICAIAALAPNARSATQPSQAAPHTTSYEDTVARARALAAQKDFKDAVGAAEQAIQMDDKRWEAYVVAAEAYSGQQFYDDAIGMLQSALTRAPQEKKQLISDAIGETRKLLSAPATVAAPTSNPGTPAATAQATQALTPATATTQAEIILWKSIENSKSASDYRAYLDAYPNGVYAPLANRRIQQSDQPGQDTAKAKARIRELLSWVQENASRDAISEYKIDQVFEITSVNECVITSVVTSSAGDKRGNKKDLNQSVTPIDLSKIAKSSINIVPQRSLWSVQLLDADNPKATSSFLALPLSAVYFKDRATAAQGLDKLVEAADLCHSVSSSRSSDNSSQGSTVAPIQAQGSDAPASRESRSVAPARAAPGTRRR